MRIVATDRPGPERLIRYCARPPFALPTPPTTFALPADPEPIPEDDLDRSWGA